MKGYLLPKTVDENTLVVVTSVSGNTQEPLMILENSKNSKAKFIAFSSGGMIKKYALKNEINYGQSYSINKGILNSNYNTIVTIDGDGQNNPKDIPNLVNQYFENDNICLVGGIRNKRKDSIVKIISSKFVTKIKIISAVFTMDLS